MIWLLNRALPAETVKFGSVIMLVIATGCQPQPQPQAEQANNATPNPVQQVPWGSSSRTGDRVFFDYDSSGLTAEAKAIIERQVAFAKQHADMTFTIEGHCDDRGTREYNLALGQRRADAVRRAWVALGIDPKRLQTISYGSERPAVVGENEAAWAQNRRAVEMVN